MITTEQSSKTHTGNGATTVFPTTFRFLANSHLSVYVNSVLQTEVTHYTVDGAGDPEPGGSITFLTAPANGAVVYIERNTPVLQLTDLRPEGRLIADDIEEMYDYRCMVEQELRRDLNEVQAVTTPAVISAGSIVFANHTFTVDPDDVESSFPMNVAVASGSTATSAWCTRLQNLTNPSEVFDEPPAIQWEPGVGSNVSLKRVSGLQPGNQYTIRIAVVIP